MRVSLRITKEIIVEIDTIASGQILAELRKERAKLSEEKRTYTIESLRAQKGSFPGEVQNGLQELRTKRSARERIRTNDWIMKSLASSIANRTDISKRRWRYDSFTN